MTHAKTIDDNLRDMTRHRDSLILENEALRSELNRGVRLDLSASASSVLRARAERRDMPVRRLAAVLIETICNDDLFVAVLDT